MITPSWVVPVACKALILATNEDVSVTHWFSYLEVT